MLGQTCNDLFNLTHHDKPVQWFNIIVLGIEAASSILSDIRLSHIFAPLLWFADYGHCYCSLPLNVILHNQIYFLFGHFLLHLFFYEF